MPRVRVSLCTAVVLLLITDVAALRVDKMRFHKVLMVIDMQNDYCSDCGVVGGSPWSEPLAEAANNIGRLMSDNPWKDAWARVFFTQDYSENGWTATNTADGSKYSFLKWGTPGAAIIQIIEDKMNPTKPRSRFVKSTDDWMTDLGLKETHDNELHYGHNNLVVRATMHQLLQEHGFFPWNSHLFVTGTAYNRCVLKGAIHAVRLGYKVTVLKNATGGHATVADRWPVETLPIIAPSGPWPIDVPQTMPNPWLCKNTATCQAFQNYDIEMKKRREWLENMYLSNEPRGGPTGEMAEQYMSSAGITIDSTTTFDSVRACMPMMPDCGHFVGNYSEDAETGCTALYEWATKHFS